ncbi:hypothetical protein BC629DRAFT_1493234 [Irpex lacteus]|nr:hypothetical protein BC629DRAFT_1493234 [Irpex lacteus]
MDLSVMANSSLAAISRILDSVRSELVASWPTQAVNTPQHDSPYLVKLAFDLIDLHYAVLGNKITLLWVSMIVLAINSVVWVLLPDSFKYPQYANKSVQTVSHCAPHEDKVNLSTTNTLTEGIAQASTPIFTEPELPVAKMDSLPMSDLSVSTSTEQPLQDTALLDPLPEPQEPTNLPASVSHDVPLTLPEIVVHPAPTNEINSSPLVPDPSSTQDTVLQSCVASETSTSPEPAVVVTEATTAIGDEGPTPAEKVEDANNDLGVSATEAMIGVS